MGVSFKLGGGPRLSFYFMKLTISYLRLAFDFISLIPKADLTLTLKTVINN